MQLIELRYVVHETNKEQSVSVVMKFQFLLLYMFRTLYILLARMHERTKYFHVYGYFASGTNAYNCLYE